MKPTRRELLSAALAVPFVAEAGVARYLEGLARADGGYGWGVDPHSHLTPTFAVVACYQLLGKQPPNKAAVARFLRENYPLLPARHKDRPLRRFDYEQIRGLLWLGEDLSGFREEARGWVGPSIYTRTYEHEGYPVFQHEVMALLCRALAGIDAATPEWKAYVLSRRRADGSFNNTPAADGGGGHVMNTWWGLQALQVLGEQAGGRDLMAWLQACQLAGGGFTWQPKPEMGGLDDAAYAWAAVSALAALSAKPARAAECAEWLHSLRNPDGGYGDRPGRLSNPLATFYAMDALRVLGEPVRPSRRKAPAVKPVPAGLRVFSIQIEAPGAGSPAEAVELARALKIHIWAAKNAPEGWVARCQQVADRRKAPVLFAIGNEEYGSYQRVAGLGSPSHLADLVAPPGVDYGTPMGDRAHPTVAPWSVFRDRRIAALRRAGGRMIWQFNENEELTRVLLDEAVERGTYAGISTYHFGNENFLDTQPFLMRYYDVLPFVALQDAHTRESWWWADQLAGLRTVYLARDGSWEGWLEALKENRVMAIRHDAVSNYVTCLAGGSSEVRRRVLAAEDRWRWWGREPDEIVRPAASLVALRPGEPFEAGAPESGIALRVRCRHQNTTMGMPKAAQVELVRLTVDGAAVETRLVDTRMDRYHIHRIARLRPGRHTAEAQVRTIATGDESSLSIEFGEEAV